MNKKGQTLMLFILFVPLLMVVCALIIDTGLIIKEKIELNQVTKTILNEVYEYKNDIDTNDRIRDLYSKNNISIDNIAITNNDNELIITNSYYIDSMFGKIINIDEYHIKSSYSAYIENEELKIEKE